MARDTVLHSYDDTLFIPALYSPTEFLSTFYSSLTRESSLVLVSLPVFFLVLAAMAALVALPSLLVSRLDSRISEQEEVLSDQADILQILGDTRESLHDQPRHHVEWS